MTPRFEEFRLDDEAALARADNVLRLLAESGARVRREAAEAETPQVLAQTADASPPRAVVAAGPDSRLLRAVLEPWCPVPFVAWPGHGLPGWAGALDLVVVLAPDGSDVDAASSAAEAIRRGCQVVVACPRHSLVDEHAAGRWTTLLPTVTRDQLATAVIVLDYLDRLGLGPRADAEQVAAALDEVAVGCSPHRDLAVNPAKAAAIALADSSPLFWGGSMLAARAARRVAESVRQATGVSAIAGNAEHLLPIVQAAPPRDVFDDPVSDGSRPRPVLMVLDDGAEDPLIREERGRLQATAAERGVRVERLTATASTDVARYASLLLQGQYVAAYLRVGLE